ncbi:hypothetical protein [Microvirga zambiensis]|uniref:hypothetical protein n=1 Tax=Microvirga zambiensis TaxID=1402137 RepID=UPI00191E3C2E|nr:hypothetical protein [Microvirga zambiensis]
MDQPYSAWADWLSKFHTWPESIQALWLLAVPATLLGMTWLVMRGLAEIVRLARGDRIRPTIRRPGPTPEATDRENPPEPTGRGAVVQGVFGWRNE